MNIQLIQVSSSQIEAMGHNEERSILRVKFVKGGLYEYQNVSKEVFDSIMSADSVGSTFHKMVKSNPTTYPYTKIS
jgi:hypothetical protein